MLSAFFLEYKSMAEELHIEATEKEGKYLELLPQLQSLMKEEPDKVANLANVAAALAQTFHFFWVGFYLVKGDELVLGPFQGPVACTRIARGKGVCGTAWEKKEIVLVPDVDDFPGHIACSSESRSEVVVPIIRSGEVVGVLDVDSKMYSDFSAVDAHYLEKLCAMLPL